MDVSGLVTRELYDRIWRGLASFTSTTHGVVGCFPYRVCCVGHPPRSDRRPAFSPRAPPQHRHQGLRSRAPPHPHTRSAITASRGACRSATCRSRRRSGHAPPRSGQSTTARPTGGRLRARARRGAA
eukprot:1197726-Prymnesium_polylepis.1